MQIVKALVLAMVLIVLGAMLMLTFVKLPPPFLAGTESEALLQAGDFEVDSFSVTLKDTHRETASNGDYAGADSRSLTATVWHPGETDKSASRAFPLLVYSHGFSSSRESGRHIGRHLASYGYVVISADYPLTHFFAPGGPNVLDIVNQPGDVSFLIDSVLEWNGDSKHSLYGLIDRERIAVTGTSLGGMTSTLAAFHPDMRDPRIRAALSIAGPSMMFSEDFYRNAPVPFMMLASDQDVVVNFQDNALPVIERVPGAQLVTLTKGSHTGFAAASGLLRWFDNPDTVACYVVLSNLKESDLQWYEQLGTQEQGIIYRETPLPCPDATLPDAMNPLRQLMLTKVVVLSFFESQFSLRAEDRAQHQRYLSEVMGRELSELHYQRAAL